jgi:hypothetical protein
MKEDEAGSPGSHIFYLLKDEELVMPQLLPAGR